MKPGPDRLWKRLSNSYKVVKKYGSDLGSSGSDLGHSSSDLEQQRYKLTAVEGDIAITGQESHVILKYSERKKDRLLSDTVDAVNVPLYVDFQKWHYADISGILFMAWHWHSYTIVLSYLSVSFRIWAPEEFRMVALFDRLLFASIFVIFGFCLGFRNVRANNRIRDAQVAVLKTFSSIWNLILLFPKGTRGKIREGLMEVLRRYAEYIRLTGHRSKSWYVIIGMRPSERNDAAMFSGPGPRPLLVDVLELAEREACDIERPSQGTAGSGKDIGLYSAKRRMVWSQSQVLLEAFDELCELNIPAVSDMYGALLSASLTIFAIIFPWGLKFHHFDTTRIPVGFTIPDSAIMVLEHTLIMMVVLGLNALAQEHEDPLGTDREDVVLTEFVQLFELLMQDYERDRDEIEDKSLKLSSLGQKKYAAGQISPEKSVLISAHLCGADPYDMERLKDKLAVEEAELPDMEKIQSEPTLPLSKPGRDSLNLALSRSTPDLNPPG